jgi:hypothetical protein
VIRSAIYALLLVALLTPCLNAQVQTGNIFGKTTDKDSSPLPGVTVTLTGVGAPQTFVSDQHGDFRFLNLSPGTYQLRAELSGYGSAVRQGVSVSLGQNAEVNLALAATMAESITVTAEAPLLDTRKAGTAINVTKVELEAVPTSRDPWTILQQAPSVQIDRMNVGGNQSGQQSNYIGKGSSGRENTWNIDGVNITDNGATGSSPTYYDFDAFEEMQITTGGSDPRIQTPGVQLNMVTKRGTNDFKGSGRYFYTPGGYQADATVPSEATPYLERTNQINYVRDYGGELGGPIWKDHLWFWFARADQKISNDSSLRVGGLALPDDIILRNLNAKLNAQLAPKNSAVLFYDFGDKVRNARNLSPSRPFETTWKQTGPSKVWKLEDTHIFGSSFYLTGMASKVEGGFALDPNGGQGPDAPPAWRDVQNVWHNTFAFYRTDRPQEQYRADASKFLDIGSMSHELKFGFGYRQTPVESSSGWPGPAQGYVRNRTPGFCQGNGLEPGCSSFVLFRDSNKAYDTNYKELYLGDTILLGNLTIQAGLRYDQQTSSNSASSSPANPVLATPLNLPGADFQPWLPAIEFAGDDRDLEWTSVSPRLGFTYALGQDKKTLLRAGYNRYVSQIGAVAALGSPFTYYSYWIVLGYDRNDDKIAQRDELLQLFGWAYIDPSAPDATAGATRLDYGMNAPRTDEFIIGGEREILPNFSIGLNFSHRKYNDLLEIRYEKTQGRGDFYTADDFVVGGTAGGTFTDPYSGETRQFPSVPYYVLREGVPAPIYGVIRNRPDYSQTYNGIELTATKRLTNRWMMRANFSWNDWTEDTGSDGFFDPTPRTMQVTSPHPGCVGNCNGQVVERSAGSGAFQNVFINSKWSFNVTGLYQFPWDVSLGASVVGRQGYPAVYRDQVTTDAAPLGFNDVILNDIGEVRFPNVYEFDLRLAKEFRIMNKVGVTLAADLFNVPNQRTVLQRDTLVFFDGEASGSGNEITELQSPRVWRFSARITY